MRAIQVIQLAALLLVLLLGGDVGCGSEEPRASARVITSRAQLVGGDRALGEIGDYLLENDRIRVVIQRPGFSRGFGVYGGSLIDADLRRSSETGTSGEASGFDAFGELFPSFFVQAAAVDTVRIVSDGSNGGPARVEASGRAGDFLELVAILNRAVTGSNADYQNAKSNPRLRYSTTYELAPGSRHVTVRFEVENISSETLTFPGSDAKLLLGLLNLPLEGFTVPVGDIALYGAASEVFMPGIGFDLRFGLEAAYARKIAWPAFPGFVTEFIASRGSQTSYGLVVEESDANYAYNKRAVYEDGRTPITKSSLLIPFVASSFVGVFYQDAPVELLPKRSFSVTKHFIVGSGDVGSVLDEVNLIRRVGVGRLGGQVIDVQTGTPSTGTSVLVYQRTPGRTDRRIYSQYDVREDGLFGGTLAPGLYSLRITGNGRHISKYVDFEIAAGKTTGLRLATERPGRVQVRVLDDAGDSIPAKVTAVGRYDAQYSGQLPRRFLFDLPAGEPFRSTDVVPDDPENAETRRYVEGVAFTRAGVAEVTVRPGTYDIVTSRGPEYDTQSTRVVVRAGETASISHALRRVVDTAGWIAADTHIHSRNSIDSAMTLDERVVSLAAEGVEWAVSTDHNYVTDYAPYIARNDLNRFVFPSVGVEMTTLESGHFNGYPLIYQTGPITHGAFEWARRTPDDIFEEMRRMGRYGPAKTIVQVNHPRDQILGYYSQYARDALTASEMPASVLGSLVAPTGPAFRKANGETTFSFQYDAVELANGKLYWQIHHFRVPDQLPPVELPPDVPPAGTILRDKEGEVIFPGVVDDWFNLLNLGHRFVGVGTGDSHAAGDEAGQFRTMIHVGDDAPSALREERIVDALRSRRVLVTNGPLLDFYVNDPRAGAMGQSVVDGDGSVTLGYSLTSAPWISVGRINVYRNGVIVSSVPVDENQDLARAPLKNALDLELARDAAGTPIDSWFVVEAIGYRSMFPVIRPLEVPPVVLTDAIASLAGPLGIGNDEFGALRPPEVFPITAYAITNPVWVTVASGSFHPPGVVPIEVQNLPENDPKFQAGIYVRSTVSDEVRKAKLVTPLIRRTEPSRRHVPLFYPRGDNPLDVRKALSRMGHLGGHTH